MLVRPICADGVLVSLTDSTFHWGLPTMAAPDMLVNGTLTQSSLTLHLRLTQLREGTLSTICERDDSPSPGEQREARGGSTQVYKADKIQVGRRCEGGAEVLTKTPENLSSEFRKTCLETKLQSLPSKVCKLGQPGEPAQSDHCPVTYLLTPAAPQYLTLRPPLALAFPARK